jgi:large subunit ribosomal protein L15
MRLDSLKPAPGSTHRAKRVGRGIGSGHGKTSGRGSKGQRARGSVRTGFEGGQTPIQRRLRKLKGISQTAMNIGVFRKEYAIINVRDLERFAEGTVVEPIMLVELRIIKSLGEGLRVLAQGDLTKKLTVKAHHFSTAAKEKIEAAGGSTEVL